MNILSRFASILFTFIFFIQSSSWAAPKPSQVEQAMMKRVMEQYSGMNATQKREELSLLMKKRPVADQEFFKKHVDDPAFTFPELKYGEGELILTIGKQTVGFVPKSATTITVKGKDIDLGPGKLKAAVYELEELLQKKTSRSFNILFDEAYASGPVIIAAFIVLGAVLLIAASEMDKRFVDQSMSKCTNLLKQGIPTKGTAAYDQLLVDAQRLERDLRLENLNDVRVEGFTFLHWIKQCVQTIKEGKLPTVFKELSRHEMSYICETYREKSDSIRTRPTDSDIEEMNLEVNKLRKDLTIFQKTCFYNQVECKRVVTCLEDVANDLGSMKKSVSQTERSVIEEVPRRTSKEIPPSSASGKKE